MKREVVFQHIITVEIEDEDIYNLCNLENELAYQGASYETRNKTIQYLKNKGYKLCVRNVKNIKIL